MQKRHNSIANTQELCLSCTHTLICHTYLSTLRSSLNTCILLIYRQENPFKTTHQLDKMTYHLFIAKVIPEPMLTYCQLNEIPISPIIISQHYSDVIMSAMASQITSLTIVYSTVYSGTDQRKHQSSASLAFVRGIYQWLVNSPHKWPVMRKMFPFDDVIMDNAFLQNGRHFVLVRKCWIWDCDVMRLIFPNCTTRWRWCNETS